MFFFRREKIQIAPAHEALKACFESARFLVTLIWDNYDFYGVDVCLFIECVSRRIFCASYNLPVIIPWFIFYENYLHTIHWLTS